MAIVKDKDSTPITASNIFFNSVVSGIRLDLEALSADVKNKIDTLNFGAIILEANLIHMERKGFSIGIEAIYNDDIDPVLFELLKHMFPENSIDVSHRIPFSI